LAHCSRSARLASRSSSAAGEDGPVRGKGINYDTGFYLDPPGSGPEFSPDIVTREMRVIASELGCTAVWVSGGKPEQLSAAPEAAALCQSPFRFQSGLPARQQAERREGEACGLIGK
jgi:hypothetical protein